MRERDIPTPMGEMIDFYEADGGKPKPIEKSLEPWQNSSKPIRPNPAGGKKK